MKMIDPNIRARLEALKTNVTALNGRTAHPTAMAGLDRVFEAAMQNGEGNVRCPNTGRETTMANLITEARNGVAESITALNALRMETIDLSLRATSQFASLFFEPIRLGDDEQVCIMTTYQNRTRVKYLAEDGGAETLKAVRAGKKIYRDLRELSTRSITYPVRDVNGGPAVVDAARATFDLAFDMANKVDTEAFNILHGGTINGLSYGTSIYGAFTTTGASLDRTYLINARAQTANLPTTNLIINSALDDSAATNKFRLAVIRAIIKYCDSWGGVLGSLRPTGVILIPSSETTQLAEGITPTGQYSSQITEQIQVTYTMFDYMGVHWVLVGDVTLPPGACYPVLSQPVGKMYVKPQFDEEFVETNREKNFERRSMMKALNLVVEEPHRPRALKVVYSSTVGAGVVSTNE